MSRLIVVKASELPEPVTSYFLPWSMEMIYEIEPELKSIVQYAIAQKHRHIAARYSAYSAAKLNSNKLIGWGARDPRLRSSEAYDAYLGYILGELKI